MLSINNDLRVKTGVDAEGKDVFSVTLRPPQLHDMKAPEKVSIADANILYAAEWDGRSPWIVLRKGEISDLKLAYMGWPMVTKAEWEAANPVVAPAPKVITT